ncbi:trihelix transcription factor ENAP2 [Malania oleifera]|uniref:trihelix transcription factor ENAP2 n=1 Tax=Malania oleifera TaxID=397392 RepID=UPI0025AE72CA|nr:trihelix transcription factor ENAP2 [Malania oleifera]
MALASSSSAPDHPQRPSLSVSSAAVFPKALPLPTVASPAKKPLPLPWTPLETTHLIEAYQEKWYSLKRGQLKASQWEEVAITVAARCGYDEPSKTATQCRHKIEKLRKRYRTEKQRTGLSPWQFFDLMDRMEHGPLPISARPMAVAEFPNSEEENENYYNNDDFLENYINKSRSINYIVRAPSGVESNVGDRKKLSSLRNPMFRRRRKVFEDAEDEEDEDEEEEEAVVEERDGEGARGVISELTMEIKGFAERFIRMENKKMEMMRETERYRMEMDSKRMDMILDSQRKILDTISRTIGSHKKLKMAED